ncbi:MAG TPA: hypothetical protein VFO18_02780 [Methylomirabilota bacterium]|nr:hypothetical protein [Methylomirabilota bacterium]
MHSLLRSLTAAFLVLTVTAPVSATVVKIETAASLADQSEKSLDSALSEALEKSIRGAAAMGLSRVWFDQAFVMPGRVVVRMLATDEEIEGEDEAASAEPMPSLTVPQPGWLPDAAAVRRETL